MAFALVLDAEVVDDEDEEDGAPFMSPESGSCGALVVPMRCETFSEEIVREFTCLFEAVHSISDFKVDPPIVYLFSQVVFVDEFLWNDRDLDADIFRPIEWHPQVEVFDVKAGEFCIWCSKYTVGDEFDEFK